MNQNDIHEAIAQHEAKFSRYGWAFVGLLFLHDVLIIVALKLIS